MAKYLVIGEVTISCNTVVEANSPGEAKKLALDRSMMSLCHQCADSENDNDEWVTCGELDGEPRIIGAEEYE